MNKILKILGSIPLFKGLSELQLGEIWGIAQDRFYDKGKRIFSEGDNGGGFYAVASGRVKVFKLSSEGKEHILHVYGPGNAFGVVPLFSGEQYPRNAETLLKSHLLFFPRAPFMTLISGNPSLCMNFLVDLSLRLRQLTIQIENLVLMEVPGRLASYLLCLNDEEEHRDSLSLSISKRQLASLLGTIPETLSRILLKMSNAGLIEVKGKDIEILDRESLKELAETGKFVS